jgi:sporulation protein YlmC with PRC-barrel domain
VRNLRIGEEVLGSDGRRLGTVDRLVVDERAHRVTHLVIGGHLLGVGRVRDAGGARLTADLDRDGLARQPEARPELAREPGGHWRAPGGYSLGDFLAIASALVGPGPYTPPAHLDLDLSAVHEITPGSPVFSGRQHVGDVSQVETDEAGEITTLVLHRPGILGARVLLPPDRVTEVIGSTVHVDLTAADLEALPAYEERQRG